MWRKTRDHLFESDEVTFISYLKTKIARELTVTCFIYLKPKNAHTFFKCRECACSIRDATEIRQREGVQLDGEKGPQVFQVEKYEFRL